MEADVAADVAQFDGVGLLLDGRLGIEDLEDALAGHLGAGGYHDDPAQHAHWHVEDG